MKPSLTALLASLTLLVSAPALADESGSFVVRLGLDTTSVETYHRAANRLEIDQVGRAPRVLQRHFVYDLGGGAMTKFSMVVTPPGSTTPTQTVEAALAGDSLRVRTKSGDAAAQTSSVVASGSPTA